MARARIRVATEGTHAVADDYGNSNPVAGLVLTSQGPGVAPDWAPGGGVGGTVVAVNQTLFVDGFNSGGPGFSTGDLESPFTTIQEALDEGVTRGWSQMWVRIAPGTYADPILVSNTFFFVCFEGWSANHAAPAASPEITANIVVEGGIAGTPILQLERVFMSGNGHPGTIAPDLPANDLNVVLVDSRCAAAIQDATNITLTLSRSNLYANVTATGALEVEFDGYSWYQCVQTGVVFAPIGYTRRFRDTGANTFTWTLTQAGLAVGATAFITRAVPDVRAGDFAVPQCVSPAAVDYQVGFHSSSAGNLIFWLTNLSRNGGGGTGDFAEEFSALIFHAGMAAVSPP
jgi:hypothetical protein